MSSSSSKGSSNNAEYYKFDVGNLPDALFQNNVPVQKWLESDVTTTTSDKNGFPPNTLNKSIKISKHVEFERVVGMALYFIGNALPFFLVILVMLSIFMTIARYVLMFVVTYVMVLFVVENYYFKPYFLRKYNRPLSGKLSGNIKDNQYLYTERNNMKYCSAKFVWPKSIQRPALESKPVIFCAIPHGVAPLGITAYPVWSKLFSDKLCHWTCAPIVLKLPVIGYFMNKIGYIQAKSKDISDVLTKKEENVGIILDGIAGMFQSHDEIGHIKQRKGIIKIALRTGSTIVPVYGFGHTSLWTTLVDPFGILEYLSLKLDTSITPFFGRWLWFLGPPERTPLAICCGEPVHSTKVDEPTTEDINKYHAQLLKHYEDLFNKHKAAYGWKDKKLTFV